MKTAHVKLKGPLKNNNNNKNNNKKQRKKHPGHTLRIVVSQYRRK